MSQPSAIVDRLESAIARLEARSSAEVVVSVAARSGKYGDVDLLWGWLVGLAVLAMILWSPWSFHPDFILLNVILGGLIGWFLSRRLPAARRLLTTEARRQCQVEQACALEFLKAGVDGTRGRSGILIYASGMERRLALRLDRGAASTVPAEVVRDWLERFGAAPGLERLLESLPEALEALAEPLSRHIPSTTLDTDELKNQLRQETT
jgi:putative membrane protein